MVQSHDDRVRDAQRVVVEVARTISSSLDLLAVAKTVVDAAVKVVGSDRCAIYLVSADQTHVEPLWGIDVNDPRTAEQLFFANTIPIDTLPLLGYSLAHPEPVVIDDTERHPLSNPELFRFFDTRTVINVGLRGRDGQVFALMPFLWTGQPHAVREDDIFFAQSLAALAEVALSNARLFAQNERERTRAIAINAVAHDVNSGQTLDDTLKRAIGNVVTQLNGDDGSIFLLHTDGDAIIGAVETNVIESSRIGVTLKLDSSPNIARAVDRQRMLLVSRNEALGQERDWFASLQITAALYIPLLSQGRLLGMAFVNYIHQAPRLEADDERFVDALADQCALAIERAQLLDSASRRAAELEAVIEQMGEGVVIADRDGRITLVNEYAAKLHGVVSLDVEPEGYSETYRLYRLDGTPYPPLELPLSRAVLHGETSINAEWGIHRLDGSEVIASGSAKPIIDSDGRQFGAVLVVRDVTARRKLESEKDQFLSVVSHELKTPLTTVKGLSELARRRLARGADPADVLMSLDGVANQVRRMEVLINNLLDVQRLETGLFPLVCKPRDMAPIIVEARDRAQAMTDHHRVDISLPRQRLVANVDEGRIAQVLDNLLSNAIKYSPDGGIIRLVLAEDGQHVVLRVQDQGIGIPDQGRERLFERFYRGANVPAGEYGGLGIGLALSHEIVQRHDGKLELEETSPQGTTFKLCLPLVEVTP
jgi:PAS domain S-box-containing protein